jgi:hypothetical protein
MRSIARKGAEAALAADPNRLKRMAKKGGEARAKQIAAAKGGPVERRRKPKPSPTPDLDALPSNPVADTLGRWLAEL